MTPDEVVRALADLFASEGAKSCPGEPVSQAAHMLQTAALAGAGGASGALVAAALLHDVGHFTGAVTGLDLMHGTDNHHSDTGAGWLSAWFGPEVTEPVRLHVAAKRYLCATSPGYTAALSDAARCTLGWQGGPMRPDELARFEANQFAKAAVRLRRWDDAAKDPRARVPGFGYYRPLLRSLARARGR